MEPARSPTAASSGGRSRTLSELAGKTGAKLVTSRSQDSGGGSGGDGAASGAALQYAGSKSAPGGLSLSSGRTLSSLGRQRSEVLVGSGAKPLVDEIEAAPAALVLDPTEAASGQPSLAPLGGRTPTKKASGTLGDLGRTTSIESGGAWSERAVKR